MRVIASIALALLAGCVRTGSSSPGDAPGRRDGAGDRRIAGPESGRPRDARMPADRGAPADANDPSPDAGRVTGQTSCKSPAVVDMAKQPVQLELDFTSAGCIDPSLGVICSCTTGKQHLLRLINTQGKKVSVDCTSGGDKVYIHSEPYSSQCPPATSSPSSLACPLGVSTSHGYGEYLLVCRRDQHGPLVSLELTFK